MAYGKMTDRELMQFADKIRFYAIRSMCKAGGGHVGGVLSACDLAAVLYGKILNIDPKNPAWDERDKVVMSKGHCGPALYTALALSGYFPVRELDTLNCPGGHLPSHCDKSKTVGIDMTTGSLGQGASTAAGMALGKKLLNKPGNVFLILGDGEVNEGQVWEMAQFAVQHKLDNLITFVDRNHQQLDGWTKDILDLKDIAGNFASFGFQTATVDGSDVKAIREAAEEALRAENGIPWCIVLDTVKGKGWSVTEGKTGIHHMALSEDMLKEAEQEFAAKGVNVHEGV